ncbi:unnamed protein product, partial [Amoebophrya sp. A25]
SKETEQVTLYYEMSLDSPDVDPSSTSTLETATGVKHTSESPTSSPTTSASPQNQKPHPPPISCTTHHQQPESPATSAKSGAMSRQLSEMNKTD